MPCQVCHECYAMYVMLCHDKCYALCHVILSKMMMMLCYDEMKSVVEILFISIVTSYSMLTNNKPQGKDHIRVSYHPPQGRDFMFMIPRWLGTLQTLAFCGMRAMFMGTYTRGPHKLKKIRSLS